MKSLCSNPLSQLISLDPLFSIFPLSQLPSFFIYLHHNSQYIDKSSIWFFSPKIIQFRFYLFSSKSRTLWTWIFRTFCCCRDPPGKCLTVYFHILFSFVHTSELRKNNSLLYTSELCNNNEIFSHVILGL